MKNKETEQKKTKRLRPANNYYFRAMFQYAALGEDDSVSRIKNKFEESCGISFNPFDRPDEWRITRREIIRADYHAIGYYNPKNILEKFEIRFAGKEQFLQFLDNPVPREVRVYKGA